MKIILCTGDSHTQGQGQDTFFDPMPERPVEYYDLENGTGMAFRRIFASNCYVNLIRDFVNEKTNSSEEDAPVEWLYEFKKEEIFECDGKDMVMFSFAETTEETNINIYTDDEFLRSVKLYTPRPKWADWSVRDIKIDCSGKKEIKIVTETGKARIISMRKYKGEYAVINCGIGSCNSKTYYDICINELIHEFKPYMFIAEAHTINDWLSGKTVEEYKEHFGMLLDKMINNSTHTIAVTVAPILGAQTRCGEVLPTADYYENFVEASREVSNNKKLPIADVNAVIKKCLDGLSEKEKKYKMYADDWHVNSNGHKIYAEEIIKIIGGLL